jgi:hypothetical protein
MHYSGVCAKSHAYSGKRAAMRVISATLAKPAGQKVSVIKSQ